MICVIDNYYQKLAGVTGLEPATYRVTGDRSNQLSYTPNFFLFSGLLLSIGNNFLFLLTLFLLYWIPILILIYIPLILKK